MLLALSEEISDGRDDGVATLKVWFGLTAGTEQRIQGHQLMFVLVHLG